jgi:hypothetical protein
MLCKNVILYLPDSYLKFDTKVIRSWYICQVDNICHVDESIHPLQHCVIKCNATNVILGHWKYPDYRMVRQRTNWKERYGYINYEKHTECELPLMIDIITKFGKREDLFLLW